MRATFTIFICLLWGVFAWAQPANDDCANATNLTLSTPAPCPNTTPASNFFVFDNIGATPTTPYPTFTGCDPGGMTTGPAAEVWFTFTATTNTTEITISGLNNPQAAIFTGNACDFLTPSACGSATGTLTMTVNTLIGTSYYLLVSGGDVDDQGVFDLSFDSYNDCNPCLLGNSFTVLPPPINGTYSSGSNVTFCFTISQWDVTGTIEWFHAITFDLGSGWDASTITPTLTPPSCGGDGAWGYYDSWVGCNTGQTFGPGFAYDSASGIGCGGSPNDGDPGNNWGDGQNGCSTITPANPVQFCWSVQVTDCPPNANGADLSMVVNVWSDGDSGSWTQTGCNSGTTFDFLASAVCCNDGDPIAFSINTSCPGSSDGAIEVTGGDFPISGDAYNFFLFDAGGQLIDEVLGAIGTHTFTDLAAGTYSIQAVNSLSGCSRSVTIEVFDNPPPDAIASQLPACLGDPITLTGDVIPSDPNTTYEWTGPDGTLFGQTVVVNTPGAWTLVVTSNGCPSAPVTINVTAEVITTTASADPLVVCENQQPVSLSAQGDPTFIYDWGIYGIGQNIVVPSLATTTTFTVTVTNPVSGCSAEAEVTVNVNPLPPVSIIDPGPVCQGVPIVLEATGAVTYVWEDGQTGPIGAFTFDQQGSTTVTVVGTDAFGCVASFTLNVFVVPPPDGAITPDLANICAGEDITLTASGGLNYSWSTGQGSASITGSPQNTFPYTVTITDVNGCTDVQTVTVNVDSPVIPPTIICLEETSNSVTFSWDDVAGAYDIVVLTGQTGTLTGTTFTVGNLSPGEEVTIELTAVSGNACPDQTVTATCSAEDCPMVDIILTSPQNDICLEAINVPFNLSAEIVGGQGSGTGVWSGTGIIDANTGTFDPSVAMEGEHEIVFNYTEAGPCEYSDTITINVFNIPTANFTVDPANICVDGDSTTIIYTGDADVNNATFNWTFNGGDANPASGPGPITIGWPVAGLRTITLTVIENGCTSTTVSQTVEVEAPLQVPVIQCGTTTTTSVEFTWPEIAGAVGYSVSVITGQTGILDSTSFTVENLNPGEIVTIEVTAEGDGACGNTSAQFSCEALSCPNFIVDISVPQNDICLDGMAAPFDLSAIVNGGLGNGLAIWSGTGITDANTGTFDPSIAMEGAHLITFIYTEGPCDVTETITVNVFDVPTADFSVSPNLECINEDITVEYIGDADLSMATFTWNFSGGNASATSGPGPITVSWPTGGIPTITLSVSENGCTTSSSQDVTIEEPLAAPVINCNSTPSSITFTWNEVPGASSYMLSVLQGASGIQNGNSYEVTGLNPGDVVEIQVEAVGTGPCGSSFASADCVAENCPNVIIDLPVVNPICLDAFATIVDLDATLMGDDGTGTEAWSGPGIIDGVLGIFDPSVAMVGNHVISYTYQQGNCTYNSSLTIIVNPQPTADFTAVSPICVDGTSTITFSGSAGAMATYDWSFDDGTIVSGIGAGPYEISFPTSGTKTISLRVTDNSCESELFTQTIEVEEPLPVPVISCNSTNTSITFTWDDIAGANGFDVVQIFGQAGILNGNNYEITGLEPGDSARIRVIALDDGPCDNVAAELTCFAQDCPDIIVTINSVNALCSNEGLQTLTASASAGMGTFTWSGTGITDANAGIFDPSIVIDGTVTVSVVYTDGACTYTETSDITVNNQPTAGFTAVSPVCIDENSNMIYTGTGGLDATYDWDFDGGTIVSGMGSGPYNISWSDGGTKTITLMVTEDGCPSEVFTQTVEVEEPLPTPTISCDSDNTSITFSWDDIPGAQGFDVELVFGQAGVINGNTYEVTGLEPSDSVRIRVIALDDGPCGNTQSVLTCIAADCPDRVVEIADPGALCADDDPITLTATIDGMAGTGTYIFTGPGVVDGVAGTFNPALVAGNTVTITATYTEDVCTYTSSIQITVNAVPTANFAATSPICVDAASTVEFTGVASVDATYIWDFDDGIGGTGVGPFDVSWTNAGSKTITLTVIDNGCTSGTITQTVEVDPVLADPIINCNTASTSIEFVWNEVAGATDYDVVVTSGQTGILNGTTFTVGNLIPGEEVSIIVTAIGNGACGNSTATAACVAQDCPGFEATMTITESICLGISDNPTITFTFNTSSDGPFIVDYLNETTAVQNSITVLNGETITLTDITETSTIIFVSYSDVTLADCIYPGNQTEVITVSTPVDAGTAAQPSQLCVGIAETINLADLVINGDLGGQWSETSTIPSMGGAFNPASGTLNTGNLPAGAYTFEYLLDAVAPCEDQSVEVEVIVEEGPVADAGENMTLTCNMGMLNIGGSTTSSGSGITYQWTADDPTIIIANPDIAFPEVSQPGIYTLTVSNELGCFSTDVVEVFANFDVPVAEVTISDISCFEANDGAITISNVTGGAGGYQYALNGGPFTSTPQFGNLGAADYSLVIQDANGCFSELMLSLTQPEEVVVTLSTNLGPDNIISLGDSVRLEAIFDPSLNVDTLIWQPDSIAKGSSPVVFVNPTTATNYSVTIIDENGCSDTDDMMVLVRIERPVYIPNVFSPNEDGFNDIFYIQGGDFIKQVKTFEVFNRWGESVLALYNFQPNDASFGWDGTYRGKPVNPAVYVWYAEIEFEDGEVILYKGDVAVMK